MAVRAADRLTLVVIPTPSYIRTYYLKQPAASAVPAKPTTLAAPGWSLTEPTYTAGSTDTLYTTQLTMWGDNSFDWSDVNKSSSFEAAKLAWNLANQANGNATLASNMLTTSSADPTLGNGTGKPIGALWETTIAGVTTKRFLWTGSIWQQLELGSALIAETLTGKTITGSLIVGAEIQGVKLGGDWLELTDGTETGVEGYVGKSGYRSQYGTGSSVFPGKTMGEISVSHASPSSQPGSNADYGLVSIFTSRLSAESGQGDLNGTSTTFGRWSTHFNKPVSVYATDVEFSRAYIRDAITTSAGAIQQSSINGLGTSLAGKSDTGHTHTGAQVAQATESLRGTIELATNAEAAAGTDTTRAVTPAGLMHTFTGSYRNVIVNPDVGNAWQSIPNNTWTPLALPSGASYNITNRLNNGAAATTVLNGVSVPRAGRYLVNVAIRWTGNTGGTARGVAVRINDTGPRQMEANQRQPGGGFGPYAMPLSTTAEVVCSVGDVIQCVVVQNVGSALNGCLETYTVSYLGPA